MQQKETAPTTIGNTKNEKIEIFCTPENNIYGGRGSKS
jgi:hypothetical protein